MKVKTCMHQPGAEPLEEVWPIPNPVRRKEEVPAAPKPLRLPVKEPEKTKV